MLSRIVGLFLLMAVVIAIPLSHQALSQKKGKGPAPKVAVCHFPEDAEAGHVINISGNAVAAHIAKHGDCTDFTLDDTGACQCPTCQERCEATDELCRADCPPDDAACLADCDVALEQCLAACDTGG